MKRIGWSSNKKDIVLVYLFALLCAGLAFVPTGFEECLPQDSRFARAKVIDVENADVRQSAIVKTGVQSLTVEFLNGPFRGQRAVAANHLTGRMELDDFLVAGREILVEYSVRDGRVGTAVARGNYRLRLGLLLVILFAATLTLVAGWTGLKAMLSFLFSVLMIWKILIPLFLKEHDPILVALCVVAALSAAVSFLVGGLTRKGLVTFAGTFSGLALTCALAHFSTRALRLHGAVLPFAETLLYSGFYYLNLTRIFVASIFIACSGAVMDLAMDIAASMDEIRRKKPDIGFWEHVGSGMAVGRAGPRPGCRDRHQPHQTDRRRQRMGRDRDPMRGFVGPELPDDPVVRGHRQRRPVLPGSCPGLGRDESLRGRSPRRPGPRGSVGIAA